MAVEVNYYFDSHFTKLKGPKSDLGKLLTLLVENPATDLFQPNKLIELLDPDSDELRQSINQYIMGRSAEGDILIFCYSGYGPPIKRDDFGFSASDAIVHPENAVTLPLSVVKFSELLSSINIAIIPVTITDA